RALRAFVRVGVGEHREAEADLGAVFLRRVGDRFDCDLPLGLCADLPGHRARTIEHDEEVRRDLARGRMLASALATRDALLGGVALHAAGAVAGGGAGAFVDADVGDAAYLRVAAWRCAADRDATFFAGVAFTDRPVFVAGAVQVIAARGTATRSEEQK